jgi:large repetitive protein
LGYALKKGDCNDLNRYINPGAKEVCNGIDDNCDGVIDPPDSVDCNNYYLDRDSDGYGIDQSRCLCVSEWDFRALKRGDCDDNNNKVFPGAKEICNGLDDNCNGEVDEGENTEGCRPFYYDGDGDGYGIEKSKCLCKPQGLYRAEMSGDCNDNNPSIYPGAHEYFDRLDNNCNGIIDENPGGPPPAHRKKHHRHHNKQKGEK